MSTIYWLGAWRLISGPFLPLVGIVVVSFFGAFKTTGESGKNYEKLCRQWSLHVGEVVTLGRCQSFRFVIPSWMTVLKKNHSLSSFFFQSSQFYWMHWCQSSEISLFWVPSCLEHTIRWEHIIEWEAKPVVPLVQAWSKPKMGPGYVRGESRVMRIHL
jgi:hypothetical protein